jgi:RNA polymerase sigma-70 factor (ECF subfamily)
VKAKSDILVELLVLRAQAGDSKGLALLVHRFNGRFYRLAVRLTGDRDVAHDITQDTWMAVARGLRRLNEPARFRAWAESIVRHKCVDWIRKRTADRKNLQDAGLQAQLDARQAEPSTALERLREAIRELRADDRAILTQFYLEEWSVREIAAALSVPDGTVKSRLFHARNRLRQKLEE